LYVRLTREKPDNPWVHVQCGLALQASRRFSEAEAAFREAIQLKPDFPEAHCHLGLVLTAQGQFTHALESLRRGHALGSKDSGWHYPSAQWVQRCNRFVMLDRKLPSILRGSVEPANAAERLALASLCQLPCKRMHATAARFYAEAFEEEARYLADPPNGQILYTAARSAALAAAGQAQDATKLDEPERARLRKQARAWLGADLAGPPRTNAYEYARIRQIQHWQNDPDLASIRDADAIAKLPADEQEKCTKLWADVAALLKKVEETK
jgi:tetratricopeptide (TPR) repeat protein